MSNNKLTARDIEAVDADTFASRGYHTEHVGCGAISCSLARTAKTVEVRYTFKGKRIGRKTAARLVRSWNAPRRPAGFYWVRSSEDDWEPARWDSRYGAWDLLGANGGPYSDDDVGEIGPAISQPAALNPTPERTNDA